MESIKGFLKQATEPLLSVLLLLSRTTLALLF
jgi:hypothetical protein